VSRDSLDIDILCRVVDNFGDIGVVYRLARALSACQPQPRLRLIVDNLEAFASMAPGLDPRLELQEFRGWTLCAWGSEAAGYPRVVEEFRRRPAQLILECFACGRPDWLDRLLFEEGAGRSALIVNLEYLTAEDYADEFHKLPSLTRSPLVRKVNFMPGFSPRTGGLIIDPDFSRAQGSTKKDCAAELALGPGAEASFWVTVFTYERDFSALTRELMAFESRRREENPDFSILVLAAAGKSQTPFLQAWEAHQRPFAVKALSFLPQEAWDRLLSQSDFSLVRGEDSLSRACLFGRPFAWQAYPQEGRHHLVKVRAFLTKLLPHFNAEDAALLECLFLSLNDRDADSPATQGEDPLGPLLDRWASLAPGFQAFSAELLGNGDLARNLLTFLDEIV
jgi:uncharacterized repeat protein (TIGR03837 family)